MKAKLIKDSDGFSLCIHHETTTEFIASTGGMYMKHTLSLKNCREIEHGYDLENMADFYGAKVKGSVDFKLGANQGFEDGFKQALEIRSDKKFSEEDMIKCFNASIDDGWVRADFYIQSLQQTEWDVEIGMEDSIGIGDKYTPDTKPKLNADGCIILKRK